MLMRNQEHDTEINVVRHIILRNMWEVYITDEETDTPDRRFALVMGFETELGDVWLPEYKGHIVVDTTGRDLDHMVNMEEIMPAPGWEWKK